MVVYGPKAFAFYSFLYICHFDPALKGKSCSPRDAEKIFSYLGGSPFYT